ncbi:hypothetical protein DIPPA_14917 [Diplonema papillatum]|nr:hypothetical protein DIPPA_14917 [Diplonema papillatum]|eukprot:gene16935-25984_t
MPQKKAPIACLEQFAVARISAAVAAVELLVLVASMLHGHWFEALADDFPGVPQCQVDYGLSEEACIEWRECAARRVQCESTESRGIRPITRDHGLWSGSDGSPPINACKVFSIVAAILAPLVGANRLCASSARASDRSYYVPPPCTLCKTSAAAQLLACCIILVTFVAHAAADYNHSPPAPRLGFFLFLAAFACSVTLAFFTFFGEFARRDADVWAPKAKPPASAETRQNNGLRAPEQSQPYGEKEDRSFANIKAGTEPC